MNLYEGIYLRRSVRHFCWEAVDQKILDNILNFTNHLEMLNEDQEVQFEIIENLEGKDSPYFLVLSARKVEDYEVNAGFLMEQVMLYLMTKGLGTCFMCYRKLPIHLLPGFEPLIMLAFGKTQKNIYRESERVNRRAMSDICSFKAVVGDDIKKILNAARLAPSRFNSQPWRFVAYENRIHLFCKKDMKVWSLWGGGRRLEAGIALANLYLAAEELWYTSEMKKLDNMKEHIFKNYEYIITIILKK